ncbi:MAG: hypothetical protein BYD32DRAFT_309269 [Podila humilis]|nr:MAG: hypothetical protein BYD32DRAFT_309269 [Podila humilis]
MAPSIPDTTSRRYDLNNNNNTNSTSSTCMDPWIHLLVTSLPDPIFTCDLLGNVLALNPSAQHTFGLDLYQSIGQNLNLLFPETNLSLTSTSNAYASVATVSKGNQTKEKDKLKEPKDPHRHNNTININNNTASSLPPQGSSPNSGNAPNFASTTFDDVDKYPCSLEQLVSLKLPLKRLVTKATRDGARPFLESVSALYSSGHTHGEYNGQSGGPVGYSIVLTDVSALFPLLHDPLSNNASHPTLSPFASSTPTTSSSITNSLPKATLLEIKNESNKAHTEYDPSTSSGATSSTSSSTPKVTIVEPPSPLALPALASSSTDVPSIPQESTSDQSQIHNQDPSEAPQAPRNSVRSTSLGQLLSLSADSSSRRPRSLSVAATAVSSTPSGTQMSVSMASTTQLWHPSPPWHHSLQQHHLHLHPQQF